MLRLAPSFAASTLAALAVGQTADRTVVPDSLPDHKPFDATAQVRLVPGDRIPVTLSLKPRDYAGLVAYADAVSRPGSPLYRRWLTPQQVGDRFGATAADRRSMVDYLTAKGLKVTLVAPNGMAILAEGPAAKVGAAFGTRIATFRHKDAATGELRSFRGNATVLSLPTALASKVTGVSGLETLSRPRPRVSTLTPSLLNGLYNLTPTRNAGYGGQGRNLAISNFDGFRLSNAALYVSKYGLPVPAGGALSNVTTVVVGNEAGSGTAVGEGDLDLQMLLATAPLANIRIYDSTNDLVGVLVREAADNWADVVSESYGWNLNDATAQAAHNQHLAMTVQGMTYASASGDGGTAMTPYSYPNYDPEVLQVGGTVAEVNGATGTRNTEVGWSGSGGGWVSNSLPWNVLPAWQKGNGVPTNVNRRLVPDIALHADGTGPAFAYSVFYNGGLYAFSGTSCAAPVFAGSLGVVEQRLAAAGKGARQGRLQDLIYGMNGTSVVYYDVLAGSNGKLPKSANSNALNGTMSGARIGWDFVTGWGSIDFDAFYQSLLGRTTP